ncbi:hypothetical protein [[Flexibacter] sp. ATCC 35208]|uniref:hypothetical protein n=1 Tax=[Flexibacter] sp. ATCC 35208 TaxID=1936242 RepID=UPI0009D409DD|nr:hypothetical protein [[Flexibacter] sp. ATCC 35208]OMP74808.1 hypothetical protein BW716_33405 [[Flexibacter] sp. ATCC 35208]
MPLDELDLLFDETELSIDAPTAEQLYEMYGHFLHDFCHTPLIHRGKIVTVNRNLSHHPLFKRKFEGFVHVVTRKSGYTDKRQYDRDRANRIHWIKPILDNWDSPLVSYFERVGDDSALQYFYWVQTLQFVVILREVSPDLLLVTAYCVDKYNTEKFRKYLNEYRERKK